MLRTQSVCVLVIASLSFVVFVGAGNQSMTRRTVAAEVITQPATEPAMRWRALASSNAIASGIEIDPPDVVYTTPTPEPTPEAAVASVTTGIARAVRTLELRVATPEPVVRAYRLDDGLYAVVAAAFPAEPDKAWRVVMCESGGNPAINTGNGFYGMWQFTLSTWQLMGGQGYPHHASAAEQSMRAAALVAAQARAGNWRWRDWPVCGRL